MVIFEEEGNTSRAILQCEEDAKSSTTEVQCTLN